MDEQLEKRNGEAEKLGPAEQQVLNLLGDSDAFYIENGEVRPKRERLSKSGGTKDQE